MHVCLMHGVLSDPGIGTGAPRLWTQPEFSRSNLEAAQISGFALVLIPTLGPVRILR